MTPIIRNALLYLVLVVQPLLAFCSQFGWAFLYIAVVNFLILSVLLLLDAWLQPEGSSQHGAVASIWKKYERFTRTFLFVALLFLTIATWIEAIFVQHIGYYAIVVIWLLFVHKLIALPAIRNKQVSFLWEQFFTKDIILWYSVAVFFWLFALLPFAEFAYQLFVSTLGAFIIYIFSITKSDAIRHYRINKLFAFKMYMLVLVVSFWRSIYMISANAFSPAGWQSFIDDAQVYITNQWESVKTSLQTQNQQEQQADESSIQETGMVVTTWIQQTGMVIWTWTQQESQENTQWDNGDTQTGMSDTWSSSNLGSSPFAIDETLSYAQILPYLLQEYDIPLIDTQNIRFTNVSYANSLYPVRRTAYERKLIWSTTSPTTLIRCDTYMVMKWILAGRNIDDQQWTIFDKYRAAAENNNALNGCQRGELLQGGNI